VEHGRRPSLNGSISTAKRLSFAAATAIRFNTFCFGYNTATIFIQTKAGVCNATFSGHGADDGFTSLVVENSAPFGLLISNGNSFSFHGPDPAMVRVEAGTRQAFAS